MVKEQRSMKWKETAKRVKDGIEETLTYCDFPSKHWTRIRINNIIERLNCGIHQCTWVAASFLDSNSVRMLVYVWLSHAAGQNGATKSICEGYL